MTKRIIRAAQGKRVCAKDQDLPVPANRTPAHRTKDPPSPKPCYSEAEHPGDGSCTSFGAPAEAYPKAKRGRAVARERRYVVVAANVPATLAQTVSSIHAAALLRARNGGNCAHSGKSNDQ